MTRLNDQVIMLAEASRRSQLARNEIAVKSLLLSSNVIAASEMSAAKADNRGVVCNRRRRQHVWPFRWGRW